MSILIQAGHHSSVSELLMQKLYERGLGEPEVSFSHRLSCNQVTDTVDKLIERNKASDSNNKLADNVIVDFLLANLDKENWGWQAENNMPTFSYWRNLEPEVRFILVFDHPKYIFNHLTTNTLTTDALDKVIDNWVEYHQKMLEAIKLYQDKALLLEGRAALNNVVSLKKEMKNIAPTLELKSGWQIPKENSYSNSNPVLQKSNPTIDLIAEEILCKYPKVISVFNELLSKASISNSQKIQKTKRIELDRLLLSLNSINSESEDKQAALENKKLDEKLLQLDKENIQLKQSLVTQQHESLVNAKLVQEQLVTAEKVIEDLKKLDIKNDENSNLKIKNLELESKLLRQQLFQAQEELESSTVNVPKATTLGQENKILLSELLKAQEELEAVYSENQVLKNSSLQEPTSKAIEVTHSSIPEPLMVRYGAADRIKSDLPYILGNKIVNTKKAKDMAKLPLALAKEYKEFQLQAENEQLLPNIEDYLDSHEVEKIKNHLSYRLGITLIEGMKSPKKMIGLPKNLSKEIIGFNINKHK